MVKPVQTEALRIVGDPQELAFRYYNEGADEIIYMDIVASLYRRNLDFNLLKSVSENIFIPFTVGGGIRTLEDINKALRSGADKVAINTYAINHPEFITQAAHEFGAQCVVVAIDAKRQPDGRWEAYTDGGRERTGKDAVQWARAAIALGAGELYISSIDRDGTRQGYDLELIKSISEIAPVPVISHGGAGDMASIFRAINEGGADALSASSVFHYQDFSIAELKKYLQQRSVNVRMI